MLCGGDNNADENIENFVKSWKLKNHLEFYFYRRQVSEKMISFEMGPSNIVRYLPDLNFQLSILAIDHLHIDPTKKYLRKKPVILQMEHILKYRNLNRFENK